MSKWYGDLSNRLEEGQNFTRRDIRVGDDITMYHWSDRTCYYVTAVESQKRIKVKRWFVCADHSKEGGMGHQNWLYFRSSREMNEYLSQFYPSSNRKYIEGEDGEFTWVFRYNKWVEEFSSDDATYATDKEKKSIEKHGCYKRYFPLNGKISFGVRDYYYDWEF